MKRFINKDGNNKNLAHCSSNICMLGLLLLNIILEELAREIRHKNKMKASYWKQTSKTISTCRWYNPVFRIWCHNLAFRPRVAQILTDMLPEAVPCSCPRRTDPLVQLEVPFISGNRNTTKQSNGCSKALNYNHLSCLFYQKHVQAH